MTGTQQKWAERIAAWRESGLTSEKFCEGREFSANGLRHWAYKLGQTKRRRRDLTIPIARVLPAAAAPAPAKTVTNETVLVDSPIVVEVGRARIVVRAGFDRATLAAVVELLSAGGGAR